MHYNFEGKVTGFESYHNELDVKDFDIVVGETEVNYVFEVDFDADIGISSNSAVTWHYFHTDTLSGSIINGMIRDPILLRV